MFSFRSARKYRRNPSQKRRVLHCEPLEERRLLTVTLTNSGSNYIVTGTSSADDIRIVAPPIGDVNYDGIVNGLDTGIISGNWLTAGPTGDANYDGVVNGLDSSMVGGHWFQSSQIEFYSGGSQISGSPVNLSSITSITINAGTGDDSITIDGNLSRDVVVDGQGGNDTLEIVGNDNRGDTASTTDSAVTLFNGSTTVSYSNAEILDFEMGSTSGTDSVTISGSSGNDSIASTDTNKLLYGAQEIDLGNVEALTINGNDGDDTIDAAQLSSSIALTLNGGDGNDLLAGAGGNDTINGGDGDDALIGWGGDDTLTGGNDDDTYLFMPGPSSLGTDTINESSGAGSDTLDFEYLSDAISVDLTQTSTQTVVSSFLSIHLGSSAAYIENVVGGSGDDTITGNSLDNVLDGRGGSDTIHGGSGADAIYGGDDDDFLYGDGGADLLYGEAGDDSLYGGTGDDTYLFPWTNGQPALGSDTVYENSSEGSDTLDFSNFFPATYTSPTLSSTTGLAVGTDADSNTVLTLTLHTASTVENKTDPPGSPPEVIGLTASLTGTPGTVTLNAAVSTPGTTEVDFYLDTNHNGIQDGADTELAADTDGSDGWSVTVPSTAFASPDAQPYAFVPGNGLPPGFGTTPGPWQGPFPPGNFFPNNPAGGVFAYGAPTLVRSPTDSDITADVQIPLEAQSDTFDEEGFGDDQTARALAIVNGGARAASDDGNAYSFGTGIAKCGMIDLTEPGFGLDAIVNLATYMQASGLTGAYGSVYADNYDVEGTAQSAGMNPSHTWTVEQNGALVNGEPATHVTLSGSVVICFTGSTDCNGNPDHDSAAMVSGGSVHISGGDNSIAVNAAGGTDLGASIDVDSVTNNVEVQSDEEQSPNAYCVQVFFTWTVPVGTTISADFSTSVGIECNATAGDGIEGPEIATARAGGIFMLAASMAVVGWDANGP